MKDIAAHVNTKDERFDDVYLIYGGDNQNWKTTAEDRGDSWWIVDWELNRDFHWVDESGVSISKDVISLLFDLVSKEETKC